MTFNLSATNEDFQIVTKGGGMVVVPSSSTSAYLALSGNYLTAVPTTYKTYDDTKSSLSNDGYLTAHQSLSDYYTKNETSSAVEISTALNGKQPSGNYLTSETDPVFSSVSAAISHDISCKVMFQDGVDGATSYKNLSVINIDDSNLSGYAIALSNDALDEDALYVLNLSALNAFSQKIENVAPGTMSGDAATYGQLADLSSSLSSTLGSIPISAFDNIPQLNYSVNSICDVLSSIINILTKRGES